MASVTVNGNTYTDDASPTTGLANGGHRTRLVPMLSDAVTDLAAKQAAALASKNAAATSETNAAASAATAVNAPGTSATSTTSLTIGTGSKTLTIQTGKSIVVGMSVKIASTASPTNWMAGDVTAYNSGTGSLTVNSALTSGSGTIAAWTVSLAGATLQTVLKSGDTMTGALSVPAGASGTQVPQAQEVVLKTGATMTGALSVPAGASGAQVPQAQEVLLKTGGTMTGPIGEKKGADIASAATLDLDSATGNYLHVTGTTTVTAITLASGAERTVVFDGALTLTHNATSLMLPGGANIATAAGDRAIFRGEGSGNVRCIAYTRADGTPLSSPGWKLLSTAVANNSATVDFTGIDGAYDDYVVLLDNVVPAASATLRMRTSSDNGSTFDAGTSDYVYSGVTANTAGTIGSNSNSGTSFINLSSSSLSATASDGGCSGSISITTPSGAATKQINADLLHSNGTSVTLVQTCAIRASTAVVNAIRFLMSTGNIASGTLKLYGIKK